MLTSVREFREPGFWYFLHIFCEASSSPQISATLVGHFTVEKGSLRKSPQNFHNNCAEEIQNPGSHNSLTSVDVRWTAVWHLNSAQSRAARHSEISEAVLLFMTLHARHRSILYNWIVRVYRTMHYVVLLYRIVISDTIVSKCIALLYTSLLLSTTLYCIVLYDYIVLVYYCVVLITYNNMLFTTIALVQSWHFRRGRDPCTSLES